MPIFCDFWKRLLWYGQKSSGLWITNLGSQFSFLILPHLLRIWAPYAYLIMYMDFVCAIIDLDDNSYIFYTKINETDPKKQSNIFLGKVCMDNVFLEAALPHSFQSVSNIFPRKSNAFKKLIFAHIDFKVAIFLSSFLCGTKFGSEMFF